MKFQQRNIGEIWFVVSIHFMGQKRWTFFDFSQEQNPSFYRKWPAILSKFPSRIERQHQGRVDLYQYDWIKSYPIEMLTKSPKNSRHPIPQISSKRLTTGANSAVLSSSLGVSAGVSSAGVVGFSSSDIVNFIFSRVIEYSLCVRCLFERSRMYTEIGGWFVGRFLHEWRTIHWCLGS